VPMTSSLRTARVAGKSTRPTIWVLLAIAMLAASVLVYLRIGDEFPVASTDLDTSRHRVVGIFGATGTAGDGLLKAALADPDARLIHVITRRPSPRIEEAARRGLVKMTKHLDYRNYGSLQDLLADMDTVYWGLGTSARNVSKQEYGNIHVEFPLSFVRDWMRARPDTDMAFHLVSGAGAGEDSRMHWAREKARAEKELFELADGTRLRVISYRPSYIVPTEEQSNTLHNIVHGIFQPIKLAIRATSIGQAMLEVSARGEQLPNGTILENRDIQMYANGYLQRTDPEN
jgi:hypothetical protein